MKPREPKTEKKRPKRGNGQGGVFKQSDPVRGERWVGCLSVRSLTGKRRRVRVYGATAAEADEKLAKKKLEMQADLRPGDGGKETVGEYLTRWLVDVKPTIRPSTHRSYGQLVRLHIAPALGTIPIRKLTIREVEWFCSAKLREPRERAKPESETPAEPATLSPRYVDYCRAVLRAALNDAVRQGVVLRNVAAIAEGPRQRRYRATWLDAEQAKRLVDALQADDPKRALYVLALATGARQGELLALRWADVDVAGGTIHIQHTLQKLDGKWALLPPKTTESDRTIPLAPFALDALKAHKAAQAEVRLALGPEWVQPIPGLVFTNRTGGPLDGVNVTHGLKRRLKDAGLPATLRFHDLRHSTASLLLTQGIAPRVVADVLGHTDVRTTLNTYTHVADSVRQDAVAKLGALFQTA